MGKYLAISLLLLTGCGVGVNHLKRLPYHAIKVGDRVTLATDASIYDCEARDTTKSFWGEASAKRKCVASTRDVGRYTRVSDVIPAGTEFSVSSIKYINGIDTAYYCLYLTNPQFGTELMVTDVFFPNLLNIPDGR